MLLMLLLDELVWVSEYLVHFRLGCIFAAICWSTSNVLLCQAKHNKSMDVQVDQAHPLPAVDQTTGEPWYAAYARCAMHETVGSTAVTEE